MDCKKVLTVLYEYLDHETDQDHYLEIRKHLDLCRCCFDHVEFERLLREHIRVTTHHVCPDHVKKRIKDLLENF